MELKVCLQHFLRSWTFPGKQFWLYFALININISWFLFIYFNSCLFLPSLAPHNAPTNNAVTTGLIDGAVVSGIGTGRYLSIAVSGGLLLILTLLKATYRHSIYVGWKTDVQEISYGREQALLQEVRLNTYEEDFAPPNLTWMPAHFSWMLVSTQYPTSLFCGDNCLGTDFPISRMDPLCCESTDWWRWTFFLQQEPSQKGFLPQQNVSAPLPLLWADPEKCKARQTAVLWQQNSLSLAWKKQRLFSCGMNHEGFHHGRMPHPTPQISWFGEVEMYSFGAGTLRKLSVATAALQLLTPASWQPAPFPGKGECRLSINGFPKPWGGP